MPVKTFYAITFAFACNTLSLLLSFLHRLNDRRNQMNANLTAERLRQLVSYDPATGEFTRISGKANGHVVNTKPRKRGYLWMKLQGCRNGHAQHRLVFLYMTGAWPRDCVDHINGVKDDNRWVNLRDVSQRVNNENRRVAFPMNSLGVLGVSQPQPGKFTAHVRVLGIKRHLGTFGTAEQAHAAYRAAKALHHVGNTLGVL